MVVIIASCEFFFKHFSGYIVYISKLFKTVLFGTGTEIIRVKLLYCWCTERVGLLICIPIISTNRFSVT